jgi:predicted metal-dependent peptidase
MFDGVSSYTHKPNPKPNPDVQEVQDNRGIARMDEVAGLNDNTADKLDQQTKQLVQQVEEKLNNMGQSLKTQGNMPSEASEFIESLNRPPKVKWTRILREAFAKAKSRRREKNPTRPARRPPIKVPGGEKYNFYKGDLVRKNQTTVLLVVDTSGSMGAKELRCVEAEAKYMTNNGATVMIMQVDASVAHDPVEFKAFSKLNNFFGRGGTSFIPAFEAAENMRPWPSMMVYFTDGYGTAPANPPSFPVLWLLTSTGMNANDFKARVASWGDVAVVDVED